MSYPLAEEVHAASELADVDAVRASHAPPERGSEPKLSRDLLADAMHRRRSVRAYARDPLPRAELAELLAWSEAPIPADVPRVVRQLVTVPPSKGSAPGSTRRS